MLIGFDSIREHSQGGISQYSLPTCKIKLGLRTQVRQLDRDRHGRNVLQEDEKMKNRIGQATQKATAATFDEVTLHPDGTVEFWDCIINGFVRTRHPMKAESKNSRTQEFKKN